jgi:Protein of unknown function (DUF3887)
MNSFGMTTSVVVLLFGSGVVAQLNSATTIAKSEAVLKNLQDRKFADVFREFNPVMANAISEEKLRAVWVAMNAQFGALESIDERRSGELKGLRAAELILTFVEKQRVVQRVVFDNDGKVAGLVYQPDSMVVLPAAKRLWPLPGGQAATRPRKATWAAERRV